MAKFNYPCDVKRLTSGFRTAARKGHHGIDLALAGTHEIYAVAAGTVTKSYTSSSYGECVMIKHEIDGQTYESVYAHLRKGSRAVKEGQTVKQGQKIGIMGNTGDSSGQHLHFELHKGRWNINKTNAVDPLNYIGVEESKGSTSDETHVVKSGDTLSKIADKYNTTVANLKSLNFIQDEDMIYPGDKIKLKKATTTKKTVTPKKTSSEAVVPYPGKLIKEGSKGKDVERIQRAVGVAADGKFGPNTEKAVKAYQKRHGLSVDGIVGKNTWNKMF